MKRIVAGLAFILVACLPAWADSPATTARGAWEAAGSPPVAPPGPLAPGTPGTLWDNGPNDLVNGLSSERDTIVFGTGGPEGDHGSTIANDFDLPTGGTLDEIRVCLFATANVTLAELYIYADAGGVPGAAPIFGAPTNADLTTTTYTDNTTRCQPAFGFPGREFRWTLGGSIFLPPGTYWLAVVGDGQGGGGRAFWTTSGAIQVLSSGQIGSTFFGFPYWTPIIALGIEPEFAFDIDGTAGQSILEIPTISGVGIAALSLLLGLAAFLSLRKSRNAA